jgi:cyclic pyranopterin phosphate synthase
MASMGVTDVQLTGGSRCAPRFPNARRTPRAVDGLRDLSVTTNGYLLERDADALVDAGSRAQRLIDSLLPTASSVTRRDASPGSARLDALAKHDHLRVKINAVGIRASPRTMINSRASPANGRPLHRVHAARRRPRVDARQRLTGDEIRAAIDAVHPLWPSRASRRRRR